MARSRQRYEDLTASQRRRAIALGLIRAMLVGGVITVGYYLLPMNEPGISATVFLVISGGNFLARATRSINSCLVISWWPRTCAAQ